MNTKMERNIASMALSLSALFVPLFYLIYFLINKSEVQNVWLWGYSKARFCLLCLSITATIINMAILGFELRNRSRETPVFLTETFLKKNISTLFSILLTSCFFTIAVLFVSVFSKRIPYYLLIEATSPFVMLFSIQTMISYSLLKKVSKYQIPLNFKQDIFFNAVKLSLICILLVIAFYYIGIVFYTVINRIDFPFALEWMEGGSLVEVRRILEDLPLYVEPSIDYVPYIYTPIFFYISAFITRFIGFGFFPLRLISFISTIGIAFIIAFLSFKKSRKIYWALFSFGLFLSLFSITGYWFDIARVDILGFFFLILGVFLQFQKKEPAFLFTSLAFTLSIYTKQTFIIPIIFIFLYYIFFERKKIKKIVLPTLLSCILLLIYFLNTTNNWFYYYVFSQSGSHSLDIFNRVIPETLNILKPIAGLLIIVCYYFWSTFRINKGSRKESLFYVFFLIGLFTYSLLSKINPGGYDNVLLPFYTGIVITSGFGISKLFELKIKKVRVSSIIQLLIVCLLIVQLYSTNFSPIKQIPTDKDRKMGEEILHLLKNIDGYTYISSASYLNLYIDKPTNAHWIAISEFLGEFSDKEGNNEIGKELVRNMQQRIDMDFYELIILDANPSAYSLKIPDSYVKINMLTENGFYPITGSPTGPSLFYINKSSDY